MDWEKQKMLVAVVTCVKQLMMEENKRWSYINSSSDNNICFNQILLIKLTEFMTNDTINKIKNYYEEVIPQHSDATFKSHFRVSRRQCEIIVQLIGNSDKFRKRNAEQFGGREQICPTKALLVTLWTLATPDSYRSISERFNIAKSTVYQSMNTVVKVIIEELCPRFIRWPSIIERQNVAREFDKYGIPFCIGAIDGCHIPIHKPTESPNDYFNRKKFFSLVLQAVCTHRLSFTDVDVRWPGSVHDGRVLRTSDLYPHAQELCQPHYYVLGDSAYPCKEWLMTPCKDYGNLTARQRYYNTCHSKTRVSIENAFALLKGRFRRLKHELHRVSMQDYVETIIACCVLHNICIINDEDDLQAFIEEGHDLRHIPMIRGHYEDVDGGLEVRNHLIEHLWNHRPAMN